LSDYGRTVRAPKRKHLCTCIKIAPQRANATVEGCQTRIVQRMCDTSSGKLAQITSHVDERCTNEWTTTKLSRNTFCQVAWVSTLKNGWCRP